MTALDHTDMSPEAIASCINTRPARRSAERLSARIADDGKAIRIEYSEAPAIFKGEADQLAEFGFRLSGQVPTGDGTVAVFLRPL